MTKKNVAVVLAGGKGKRMGMDIPKQYITVNNKMLICYTLECFQNSFIDEIVVVVGKGEIDWFRENVLNKYDFPKVVSVVEGGAERYNSVYNGLMAIENADYVFIHDGARVCITQDILKRGYAAVLDKRAVVAGVKVKDTIKVVSDEGVITDTPDRNHLWQIQTPQIFEFDLIASAYRDMINDPDRGNITDDAMVMENYGNIPVHVFEADYNNIKVTTQDDLVFVKNVL